MLRSFQRLLLDPAPTEGNGNSEPSAPKPKPEESKAPDLVKAVEGLLSKHGDAASALRVLLSENHGYRDQLRELKAKLPADGSVVLSGDDAKAWGRFRTLGDFADVETRLKERDTLDAQIKAHAREKLVSEAAGLHGYDPDVLGQLPGAADLEIRVAERTVNGKAVKVAQVVGQDDQGQETLTDLDKHAEANWAKFLPSLTADSQASGPPKGTPPRRLNPPPNLGSGNENPTGRPPIRLGTL